MLKGAIFDHDGLMFDTEKIWQKIWNLVAREMGITLPDEFKKEICGSNGQHTLDVIQKYYHVEDGREIRDRVIESVAHDEIENPIEMKEGLLDILEMFQKHGVKMAVASSSPKEMILMNLKRSHLEKYFEVVVSGKDVKHGKPAPDIFLLAAEKLGIDPRECYVFEDAYNGVQAGVSAGAQTIMVPDLLQPNNEIRNIVHAVCESLKEASYLIENDLL